MFFSFSFGYKNVFRAFKNVCSLSTLKTFISSLILQDKLLDSKGFYICLFGHDLLFATYVINNKLLKDFLHYSLKVLNKFQLCLCYSIWASTNITETCTFVSFHIISHV